MRRAEWMIDCMGPEVLKGRMTAQAESFPGRQNAPGVNPYEPHELNRWAAGSASSSTRPALWWPSDVVEPLAARKHRRAFPAAGRRTRRGHDGRHPRTLRIHAM